jgi:hypothetical protein
VHGDRDRSEFFARLGHRAAKQVQIADVAHIAARAGHFLLEALEAFFGARQHSYAISIGCKSACGCRADSVTGSRN